MTIDDSLSLNLNHCHNPLMTYLTFDMIFKYGFEEKKKYQKYVWIFLKREIHSTLFYLNFHLGQNIDKILRNCLLCSEHQSKSFCGFETRSWKISKKKLHNLTASHATATAFNNKPVKNGILLPKLFWPTVRKNRLVIEKIFWNSRLKAENLQKFGDH